jgi:hypothetical protein
VARIGGWTGAADVRDAFAAWLLNDLLADSVRNSPCRQVPVTARRCSLLSDRAFFEWLPGDVGKTTRVLHVD